MAIATAVKDYLDKTGTPYSLVPHPHAWSRSKAANTAHIPPERMAKAVILIDNVGYLMAVIPANRDFRSEILSQKLRRNLADPEVSVCVGVQGLRTGRYPRAWPCLWDEHDSR